MLDRSEIRAKHWQMKRSPDGAVLGAIAAELDDLAQEIRQCILTPKRSVPLNPTKGCDLDLYRDRPLDVRQFLAAAEVREALTLWVPRIIVEGVTVAATFSQIKINVTWRPLEAVLDDFITTEIDYVF